jgi:hypothetical protein
MPIGPSKCDSDKKRQRGCENYYLVEVILKKDQQMPEAPSAGTVLLDWKGGREGNIKSLKTVF